MLQPDKQKAQYLSLFLEVLLLLSLDPTSDAEDHLEQMHDAVEAIVSQQRPASAKASSSKQAADDSDEGEEAEPISVLIDLLVTLMQRSSVLLRTVSERVFAAASGDVSEQALQLLLDVSSLSLTTNRHNLIVFSPCCAANHTGSLGVRGRC